MSNLSFRLKNFNRHKRTNRKNVSVGVEEQCIRRVMTREVVLGSRVALQRNTVGMKNVTEAAESLPAYQQIVHFVN